MKDDILKNISVVIPVYDGEKYLAEAIESVLEQTLKPYEVIVVDDGSTDNSAKVAESFFPHVKLIQMEQSGPSAARNVGVLEANGYYLAFLDADDIWMSNKLKLQMDFLASNEDIDVLFGKSIQFYSPDLPANSRKKIRLVEGAQPFHGPETLLLSKKLFLSIGLFNENYKTGENIDWYMRALDSGHKIHALNKVLVRRRIHSKNRSRFSKSHRSDYLRIVRETLARRRKDQAKQ